MKRPSVPRAQSAISRVPSSVLRQLLKTLERTLAAHRVFTAEALSAADARITRAEGRADAAEARLTALERRGPP